LQWAVSRKFKVTANSPPPTANESEQYAVGSEQ
jgi:hypothetical protein